MFRSFRRALLGAALSALFPFAIVSAHAELDSASPGPDEVVTGSPAALVATFTQDLAADRTSIEVRDAAGETIARGGKDPDSDRAQRVDLPPLEPGIYEVRWVTYSSEDDELARGTYRFTVTAAEVSPTPCPSPMDAAPASSSNAVASAAPAVEPSPEVSGAPVIDASTSVAPSLAPPSPESCVPASASMAASPAASSPVPTQAP
jgi:methionine-rich copper-binding protein CopC